MGGFPIPQIREVDSTSKAATAIDLRQNPHISGSPSRMLICSFFLRSFRRALHGFAGVLEHAASGFEVAFPSTYGG